MGLVSNTGLNEAAKQYIVWTAPVHFVNPSHKILNAAHIEVYV